MTRQEALTWKQETSRSVYQWRVDPVHRNVDDLLVYIGGQSGHYIMIFRGSLQVGTYEGAVPHIGEASFKVMGRKQFASSELALQFVVERGGVPLMLQNVTRYVFSKEQLRGRRF